MQSPPLNHTFLDAFPPEDLRLVHAKIAMINAREKAFAA